MAEVAAAAIVAEEIVSTTIQASVVGGYALAQPTLPLKATFGQLATTPVGEPTPDSLARSHHSLCVINNAAYIFGGLTSASTFAGNEMHILQLNNADTSKSQYQVIPAILIDPSNTTTNDVPSPRAGHTATVVNGKIAIYGGFGSDSPLPGKKPLDEGGRVYLFDPATLRWTAIETVSPQVPLRYDHAAAAWADKWGEKKLIIHGGGADNTSRSSPWTDTWVFDLATREWSVLPSVDSASDSGSITATSLPSLVVADNTLYLISGGDDHLASFVHMLDLSRSIDFGAQEDNDFKWTTLQFPTNPLTPGPRPRKGAALVPLKTGMGRTYLLYILGAKADSTPEGEEESQEYWSGIWSLQLPSRKNTPASVKDAARDKLGMPTHSAEWAEVAIVPVEEKGSEHTGGKAHPGPRGYFGASVVEGTTKIVIWGGLNGKGEREGDGWRIDVKGPSPPGPLDLIRGKRD